MPHVYNKSAKKSDEDLKEAELEPVKLVTTQEFFKISISVGSGAGSITGFIVGICVGAAKGAVVGSVGGPLGALAGMGIGTVSGLVTGLMAGVVVGAAGWGGITLRDYLNHTEIKVQNQLDLLNKAKKTLEEITEIRREAAKSVLEMKEEKEKMLEMLKEKTKIRDQYIELYKAVCKRETALKEEIKELNLTITTMKDQRDSANKVATLYEEVSNREKLLQDALRENDAKYKAIQVERDAIAGQLKKQTEWLEVELPKVNTKFEAIQAEFENLIQLCAPHEHQEKNQERLRQQQKSEEFERVLIQERSKLASLAHDPTTKEEGLLIETIQDAAKKYGIVETEKEEISAGDIDVALDKNIAQTRARVEELIIVKKRASSLASSSALFRQEHKLAINEGRYSPAPLKQTIV